MATTGTFAYAPSTGEVVLTAYSRIGIRGPALLAEHMTMARSESNLMQMQWSNKGPNLWAVDLVTVPLLAGISTYTVAPETIMILDAYITTLPATPNPQDRLILPISRSVYASYPDKANLAPPTVFWFDRLIAPTITVWPTPDLSTTYTLKYYRYRQIQDAALTSGLNLEIPALWLDAATAGLSHRLSRHFAPSLEAQRKVDAMEAYQIAADQNVENAPMTLVPMLGSYWRV